MDDILRDDDIKETEDDELDAPLSALGDDDLLGEDLSDEVVDDEDDVADFGGSDE